MNKRGGRSLQTGKIGVLKVLRQQLLMPGETIRCRAQGSVQMEALRERHTIPINAHMAYFATPLRWLWTDFPDYLKRGESGSGFTPTLINEKPINLGIGGEGYARSFPAFFRDNILRCYNEWYKWPEAADVTTVTEDNLKAVNLEHHWTRCRDSGAPASSLDQDVGSVSSFNVQTLAAIQGNYRQAIQREVLSYDRYLDLLKNIYDSDGSREVDQVPIKFGQADVGVDPRNMRATDAAGLGQMQSMYDFNVDDYVEFSAPEHMVIAAIMLIRLYPAADEILPLSQPNMLWSEFTGDPEIMSTRPPTGVGLSDIFPTSSATSLGVLPAGWQWRCENHVIDERIQERNSFPVMRYPTNAAEARDASRRNNAFRSQALGDYLSDIYFSIDSYAPIPSAMESYFVGMDIPRHSGQGGAYPHTDKRMQ
jgi:hypothetical protein